MAVGKDSVKVFIDTASLSGLNQVRLGFLESGNPKKFAAMLQLATLNAARTMVKPVKAKAPSRTGRLKGAVAARKGRFNKPSAVVGVKAGASRGDSKGAWYRWFVISGHKVKGSQASIGRASNPVMSWSEVAAGVSYAERKAKAGSSGKGRVPANNFVVEATQNSSVQDKATSTITNTVVAYLEGKIKYRKGRG